VPAGRVDVCNVPVPVRERVEKADKADKADKGDRRKP